MATLTAARAAAGFPVFAGRGGGNCQVAWGAYTFATNPADATVVKLCKVPAGATVVSGYVMGPDFDTDATEVLDFDIGWAANGDEIADPNGFGDLGVQSGDAITEWKPVAGIFVPFQGVLLTAGPKTFNAETTIEVVINTNAATGGTGTMSMVVFYVTP